MTRIVLNGTAAVLLQQSTASGFSMQNAGPGVLYLGNDASVTPGTGYAVAVGVALPLNSGAVLYGCTDANTTASVSLLQGAQATQATIVEANIPGAIAVTGAVNATIENPSINVTGTVNAVIENASIPVTGSVGITSGNVEITSGNVAVTGVSGNVATVPGAVPTLLASNTFAFGTGALAYNPIYTAAALNVSSYCSIIICITKGWAAGGPVTINPAQYIGADVFNLDNTSQNFAPIHAEWLLDTSMENLIRVPVTSPTMNIVISMAKAASSVGGNVGISIYGSSQTIPDIQYISQSNLLVGTCSVGGVYSKLISANNTDFISSRNGAAAFNIYGNSSVVNGVVYALQGGNALGLAAQYITASVPSVNQLMRLPLLPIKVVGGWTSGTVALSLVQ